MRNKNQISSYRPRSLTDTAPQTYAPHTEQLRFCIVNTQSIYPIQDPPPVPIKGDKGVT